jgi:hypothetical protein
LGTGVDSFDAWTEASVGADTDTPSAPDDATATVVRRMNAMAARRREPDTVISFSSHIGRFILGDHLYHAALEVGARVVFLRVDS